MTFLVFVSQVEGDCVAAPAASSPALFSSAAVPAYNLLLRVWHSKKTLNVRHYEPKHETKTFSATTPAHSLLYLGFKHTLYARHSEKTLRDILSRHSRTQPVVHSGFMKTFGCMFSIRVWGSSIMYGMLGVLGKNIRIA